MQRIKTISTYMCVFLNVMLIAFPIYLISRWFLLDWPLCKQLGLDIFLSRALITPEGIVNPSDLFFTTQMRSIGILTSLLCNITIWLWFYFARYVFENYKNGVVFSIENAKAYRKIGWLVFIDALICKPLSNMGDVLVATLSNPPGHRCITLDLDLGICLQYAFFGFLLIIISWVMIEGHRLQSEQELTI
jgi:hypothetical protein